VARTEWRRVHSCPATRVPLFAVLLKIVESVSYAENLLPQIHFEPRMVLCCRL